MRLVYGIVATLAAILVTNREVCAFTTRAPMLARRMQASRVPRRNSLSHQHQCPNPTALSAARSVVAKTSLAGNIYPVLKKFWITPAIAKAAVTNVLEITQWFDIALIGFVAYGLNPLVKLSYVRAQEDEEGEEGEDENMAPYEERKRFGAANLISQIARIALSVYVVDVVCVTLSTMGFSFPAKWQVADVWAKTAYTGWALKQFLAFKNATLCKVFKVKPDNMGRIDVFDKLLNGVIVTLVSLVLFDWLSIRMNMALRGFFAFGSVGTLAFTLASQGLLTQLVSGFFLVFSNKMYVGDNVVFGDGTAGRVTKLGWMETLLRNSDNTLTRIPNAMLVSQKVSNVSRAVQSQVKQTLRFHFEDAEMIPEILASIKEEIRKSCSRLITDGQRPFRVYWVNYNEDHLEVMVDTHHNIAPIGNAYWENRQEVLLAINRAVKKYDIEFAQLYSFATAAGEPEWRVVPKKSLSAQNAKAAALEEDEAIGGFDAIAGYGDDADMEDVDDTS